MERIDDAFVTHLRVPASSKIDYGFLTTKTHSGARIEVWDASGEAGQDYRTTVTQESVGSQAGITAIQAPLSIVDRVAQAEDALRQTWLALAAAILVAFALGLIATRLSTRRDRERFRVRTPVPISRGQRLAHLRDLLYELVVRDIKLRYRRSVLGILWSFINPLFSMLVFVFLSRRVLSLDVPNYPSFVFVGTLAWTWFSSTVVAATGSITGNRELIRRPGFPAAILPVVMVTSNMIHFVLALPVPLIFLLVRGGELSGAILMLPLVIAPQFLLTLGLGYLAATCQVTFRDTQHLLNVLFRLLYFLTPVFYDTKGLPARYQSFYRINPLTHLLAAYRAILIDGRLPEFVSLLMLGILGGVLFWGGYAIFERASHRFVEEL
jgi:lipopolysaccharide transport system permease protein